MSTHAPNSQIDGRLNRHHEVFPSFEHVYPLTYMQLADTKASVFLAMTTSAIAYLVGHYGLAWLNLENISKHLFLLSVSGTFLAISATCAFAVIVPRRPADSGRSIIHFDSVLRRTSDRHYADDVLALSRSDLFQEQLAYCFDLARICERKYRLLDRSLITGVLGYAAFLATLILL